MLILNIECNTTLFYSEQDSCLSETPGYLLLNHTENLVATIWVRELKDFFSHKKTFLQLSSPKDNISESVSKKYMDTEVFSSSFT